MSAPLAQDERAELDFLRQAVPLIGKAVDNLAEAVKRLQIRHDAQVLDEAGAAIALRQIRDRIGKAIDFLDSGRPMEARLVLQAMLIFEKSNG